MNILNNFKTFNMLNNINCSEIISRSLIDTWAPIISCKYRTVNNINNLNNLKYTITLKSKTNDPTIEKVSKIQVITYLKDNSKKVENNDVIKKGKKTKKYY